MIYEDKVYLCVSYLSMWMFVYGI